MRPNTVVEDGKQTFIETARRAQIVQSAIDTIAEFGYSGASFARIALRLGISRGLISYHFAGKDDLIKQVVRDVVERGVAYMRPRILSESTGPAVLRAYIESNLAFMRENRKDLIALVEIAHSADGRRLFYSDNDVLDAVHALKDLLSNLQTAVELRPDFDPHVMAMAIRAAIDTVPSRLAVDPAFAIDDYAREIAIAFELATRIPGE
jgi:AcrR family transcriptional regulator